MIGEDGTIRNIRALGRVSRNEKGVGVRIVGTNWDITDRKNAEEKLQKSLEEKVALLN